MGRPGHDECVPGLSSDGVEASSFDQKNSNEEP